jgi:hypothetical protein
MTGTVRTGRPAFDEQLGASFFEHLGRDRALRELFDRSQTHDQEWEIGQLLASVDFWEHRQIVNVGGGDGALLTRILQAHPHAGGALRWEFGDLLAKAGFAVRAVHRLPTAVAVIDARPIVVIP